MEKIKNFLFGENSLSTTVILVVLHFIIINYISSDMYNRFDLSKSGRLRVTASTKKVLQGIPDIVTIEAFISSDIPESHLATVKQVKDFLKEYAYASDGKVDLFILDPDSDETIQAKAKENGISPSVFKAIDESSANIEQKYLALTIYYGTEKKNILDLANTPRLEYDLTNSVFKMAYPGSRKVGFVITEGTQFRSSGEQPFQSFSNFTNYVSSFYDSIEQVNIDVKDIPSDFQVVIIPTLTTLSEIAQYRLDQFIMRGGSVLLLSSAFNFNIRQGLVGSDIPKNIIDFFTHYGIILKTGLLIDAQNFVGIPINIFQVQPYPAWVLGVEPYINQNSLVTKGISQLFFPWSGYLELNFDSFKDASGNIFIVSEILVQSAPDTSFILPQVQADPRQIMTTIQTSQNSLLKGQRILATHLKGKFTSFYNPTQNKPVRSKKYLAKSDVESHIIAITTPYAFTDSPYMRMQSIQGLYVANFEFLQSALDLCFGLEELSATRTKSVSQPILDKVTAGVKKTFTILNYLVPILVFAIIGLLKFRRRTQLSKGFYGSN